MVVVSEVKHGFGFRGVFTSWSRLSVIHPVQTKDKLIRVSHSRIFTKRLELWRLKQNSQAESGTIGRTTQDVSVYAQQGFITVPVSEFVRKLLQHLYSLSVILQLGLHQRRELAHLLDLHTQTNQIKFTWFQLLCFASLPIGEHKQLNNICNK